MTEHRVLDLSLAARAFVPALGDYPAPLQAPAVHTWRGRMLNEYGSAQVFDALAADLDDAGFDAHLGGQCRHFAEEERHHGALCAAVVLALGEEPRGIVPVRAEYPAHGDAPPRAGALRNVIHVCCLSETVAVSLIGAERLQMPVGPLRDLLTRIYADEIGHARFGWKVLERIAPTFSAEERAAIERYLPVAFAHLEHHELALLPDAGVQAPAGGEKLGLCGGAGTRSLYFETVDSVIRPGLQRWFEC